MNQPSTAFTQQQAVVPAQGESEPRIVPPVYQSLMIAGLLGAMYKRYDDADEVHQVIEIAVPNTLPYDLTRAMVLGMSGDSRRAEQALAPVFEAAPHDDLAKVVLAISKICASDATWQEDMENVLASSADPEARQLAADMVGMLLQMKN
jgi:hypothetical protein